MTVRDYLAGINPEQYHIFDSHQEMSGDRGVDHSDRDYESYRYNIHKNNKPKPGDVFLYRRPGKSTVNRKFNIYGGGVIDTITKPDDEGNVIAVIKKAFRLKKPIEQGEERIEKFEWTFKKKEPKKGWAYFWSQYGMNVIGEQDFYGLVGDLEIDIPGNINPWIGNLCEASEEIRDYVESFDLSGFRIEIETDNMETTESSFWNPKVRLLNGGYYDCTLFQNRYISLELAGELLVLELLLEQYKGEYSDIEHNAIGEHIEKTETESHSNRYDIKVTTVDEKEIRICVKTTKSQYIDGFFLTPRELNAARQCLYKEASKTKRFMIYRVYNFDMEKKTANIKIYDRFDDQNFRLERIGWKVHIR